MFRMHLLIKSGRGSDLLVSWLELNKKTYQISKSKFTGLKFCLRGKKLLWKTQEEKTLYEEIIVI